MFDPIKEQIQMDCSIGNCVKSDDSDDKRQIKITINTKDVDRDGDIVEPEGGNLKDYRRNPIVLYNHDHKKPIARCTDIKVDIDAITATVEFPPEGTSANSDEVYGLMKSGVLNAASIGFQTTKYEYLYEDSGNANSRITGLHIKEWELREFSIVSVPANPHALVVERSDGTGTIKAVDAANQKKPEIEADEPEKHDPTDVIDPVPSPIQRMKRRTEFLRLQSPDA